MTDYYTKVLHAIEEYGFVPNKEAAIRRVLEEDGNDPFAWIGDAVEIKWLTWTDCRFRQLTEEFSRKPYAIAVQQGSPLKDEFNNG